jgi:hypothetical protein
MSLCLYVFALLTTLKSMHELSISLFRPLALGIPVFTIFYSLQPITHHSRYSYSLRAGRSGDRNVVVSRFSSPVLTGPGAHPASCTVGTKWLFPGVKCPGLGINQLTPTNTEVKERLRLTLHSVWAFMAGHRMKFTFNVTVNNKSLSTRQSPEHSIKCL